MTGALAWIGQIAEWIGQFFPRFVTLDLTEGGVKSEGFFLPARLRRFKGSLRVTVCGPGLHWWWPATTQWRAWPTAFQTDNLPSQTIETADGCTITVGGMVSYRVVDLGLLLPRCHSPVKAIQTITLPAIHAVVCKMNRGELNDEQRRGTLNTKLRKSVQRELSEFGIDVVDCMLTDLVSTRAFRLIQSTQSDI